MAIRSNEVIIDLTHIDSMNHDLQTRIEENIFNDRLARFSSDICDKYTYIEDVDHCSRFLRTCSSSSISSSFLRANSSELLLVDAYFPQSDLTRACRSASSLGVLFFCFVTLICMFNKRDGRKKCSLGGLLISRAVWSERLVPTAAGNEPFPATRCPRKTEQPGSVKSRTVRS